MDNLDKLEEILKDSEDSVISNAEIQEECEKIGLDFGLDSRNAKQQMEVKPSVPTSTRELAVIKGIIPACYKDCVFDKDRIRNNIQEDWGASGKGFRVSGFNNYIEICESIIGTFKMGALPQQSYLIGAPNGFGKTSFVTECLLTRFSQDPTGVVPLISLFELSELRVAEEHRLSEPYRSSKEEFVAVKPEDIVTKPQLITSRYSWSQYINADCLFCYFSDVVSKRTESQTLKQVLNIRGFKGLPTIVLISTSLEPYTTDKTLKTLVWDEILDKTGASRFDRVKHISTFKVPKTNVFDLDDDGNNILS